MRVFLKREGAVREIAGSHTVKEILKRLDINPESVLVIRDKKILTPDVVVKEDEEIEVWPVISGG